MDQKLDGTVSPHRIQKRIVPIQLPLPSRFPPGSAMAPRRHECRSLLLMPAQSPSDEQASLPKIPDRPDTSLAPKRRVVSPTSIATFPPPITTTRSLTEAGLPNLTSRRKSSPQRTPSN